MRSEKPKDICQSLAKVDLHRHLEGSLRLATMVDIACSYDLSVPKERSELQPMVQMMPGMDYNFRTFLAKFQTLRLFFQSPEIIMRLAREAIEDAAQQLDYLELRFTPVALAKAHNFPLADVMDWVCSSVSHASQEFGLPTRLIVSVNRHEPVALAEQVASLAVTRMGLGIVGIDLAGNETDFPADPFAGLFREIKASGLKITLHAGEWGGADNVRRAIELFCADRIGHGVRVLEDLDVCALARERAIPFEVCITSNYQTGVISELTSHPILRMVKTGLNALISTDDPEISQITLVDEFRLAKSNLGFTTEMLKERTHAAAMAAFLPDGERMQLVDRLNEEMAVIGNTSDL